MKTKHTPGPWNIDETEDTVFIHADGKTIAQIELSPEVRNADDSSMLREQVHNALLIAASPEMLELLKSAQRFVSNLLGNHQLATVAEETQAERLHDFISEVIAKATGGAE